MHWFNYLQPSRHKPPWRVLFLGTDHFALHILKALHSELMKRYAGLEAVVSKLEVVTKPHKCQVSNFAHEQKSTVIHHRWPEVNIEPGQFDVGVVASFGQLIPETFINMFPYGILNVHPSLLPKWRGATPIPHSILHGDITTGITIQEIRPHRFDVGPILQQKKTLMPEDCTSFSLSEFLAQEGATLMLKTLQDLAHLEKIEVDQDNRLASYAPKIVSNDPRLYIDWEHETCIQIDRKFRALSELHDIRSYFGGTRVKLRNAVPASTMWWYTMRDSHMASRPGSVVYVKKLGFMCIQCKDGLVGIRDIVMKKPMSALSFYNGYLTKNEWKNTIFTHTANAEQSSNQSKQTILRNEELNLRRKRWHMQLLRLAMSKPD